MILKEWSSGYGDNVEDYKRLKHKIISVRKSGQGHLITYRHSTLTKRPKKGDLVEYCDGYQRKQAIVQGTEKDEWCLKDHIGLKDSIVSIGMVTKIIKKQLIPIKLFRYL